METRDLDRIRFVTRHFHDLQGLRYWVPLGLITLGGGGATYFASRPMGVLLAVLVAGSFLLMAGAKRYYRNTFGEVERPPVDPGMDVYPAAVFSPAGPTPRIEGYQVSPMARRFLATATLAMVLFSIFQAIPPSFVVEGRASLGQHPRITAQPFGVGERPWIIGRQPQPSGLFQPPWVPWVYSNIHSMRPPSTLWAVFGQMAYALYGSIFLGVWLWRERRRSQSHHLAFAVLLLGLAALGTSLGFFVRADGRIAPILDLVLPALVYPGVALFLCGVSMVLAGLLDHRQLVRALGGPAAPQVED